MSFEFTAIDLFSGPGGLSLGMKTAGIVPILAVDGSRDAVATYQSHSPECEVMQSDIREVSFDRLAGRVDVVFGGPPCQPFSLGGLRRGRKDGRDMVPEFIRAVIETAPRAFVMENVPGLMTQKYAAYCAEVIRRLDAAGFACAWRILNAADYGVPQSRRRLFIVGLRDAPFRFPVPTHGKDGGQPHVASSSVIGDNPIGEPPKSPVMYAPRVDLRPNPYHGHVYQGGGRPIDPQAPCQTIYASAGGNKTHWVDTAEIVKEYHAYLQGGGSPRSGKVPGARRLSVEESALIQAFPADTAFAGSRSSQYTQVGDAVPPPLGRAIGATLVDHLLGRTDFTGTLECRPVQQSLTVA